MKIFCLSICGLLALISMPTRAKAEIAYWENAKNFWIQDEVNHQTIFEKYSIDSFGYQHLVKKITKSDEENFLILKKVFSSHKNSEIATSENRDLPLLPSVSGQRIWRAIYSWNEDWENKYSQWIREEVDKNFFFKYQIPTDCADVPIALRWIFSRMNGLPAAFHLKGTLRLFTHESFVPGWEWLEPNKNWWEDERFLASLDYVLQNTYTHSLMLDLYPIAIQKNSFLEGTIFLNLYSEVSGHTELVSVVNADEPQPIRILASDVPQKVRELSDYGLQDWGIFPEEKKSGFLRFLWVEKRGVDWVDRNPQNMPNYSLEQYSSKFYRSYKNMPDAIIDHIFPGWKPNFSKLMKSKIEDLMQRLRNRVSIVEEGYETCSEIGGCKEGSSEYETWSTPSRDRAIRRVNDSILRLYYSTECNVSCKSELDSQLNTVLTRINSQSYYLRKALLVWKNKKYSSNPNDSIPKRWGLEK